MIKKILIFISAFTPMFVIILIKLIISVLFDAKDNNENAQPNEIILSKFQITLIIIFGILILLGIIGLIWQFTANKNKSIKIEIVDCENITDKHFLGYFSLFVLFAVSFDFNKISMCVVMAIVMFLIMIVYLKNELYYINPFLNLIGFSFYLITYSDDTGINKSARFLVNRRIEVGDILYAKLSSESFSFAKYKKLK